MPGEDDELPTGKDLTFLPADELELPALLIAGALAQGVRPVEAYLQRPPAQGDLR